METVKAQCALCNVSLKTEKYNLKTDNSKYSTTPLVSLFEKAAGKLVTVHFDICVMCYDLLNELDAIELRQTEIQNQFKTYLEHSKLRVCEMPDRLSQVTINDITINLLTDLKPNKSESISENKTKKKPCTVKSHKCHCSKAFRTASELKNHMNSHNDHRAFICEICGQSYKYKRAFNVHMNMHKGIKPFTCVYCNKAFTQKGALVRHVPIHTGEMPYQCDECGKRFVHHTSFNVHRLSHTGLKSYKCSLCDLALMSTSHLKRHMRIHTGEKKFACSTCGKRFAERYNLAVHEKLHTNPCCSHPSKKRNYSCQVCGVCFDRKIKLDEHLVTEHQMKIEVDNDDIEKYADVKENG